MPELPEVEALRLGLNKKILDKIVTRLMKIETLEQEEFEVLVGKPKAVFVIKK